MHLDNCLNIHYIHLVKQKVTTALFFKGFLNNYETSFFLVLLNHDVGISSSGFLLPAKNITAFQN